MNGSGCLSPLPVTPPCHDFAPIPAFPQKGKEPAGQFPAVMGLNVYVVNSIAKDVSMSETYKGVLPFLVSDFLRVGVLLFFPVLSLGLVRLLFK